MQYDVIIVGVDRQDVCSRHGSLRIPGGPCCCWRPALIILPWMCSPIT